MMGADVWSDHEGESLPDGIRPARQAHSACRGSDPEVFFPSRGEDVTPAKKICAGCEVSDECLNYALDNGERFGVWGGMSERERRRLRRDRAQEQRRAA